MSGTAPSLADYTTARSSQRRRNSTALWLDERPAIATEVEAHCREGRPYIAAFEWIKAHHGYPFTDSAFMTEIRNRGWV